MPVQLKQVIGIPRDGFTHEEVLRSPLTPASSSCGKWMNDSSLWSELHPAIEDPSFQAPTDHSLLELLRRRVYEVVAGYEDCSDVDHLKVDPSPRLVLGKRHDT